MLFIVTMTHFLRLKLKRGIVKAAEMCQANPHTQTASQRRGIERSIIGVSITHFTTKLSHQKTSG